RALVLLQQPFRLTRLPGGPDAAPPIDEPVGPRLFLIDLVDTPKLLSEYRFDGNLIDARQVGATVRVVLRSAPRLQFPQLAQATEKQRLTANQQAIDQAGIEAWLPRYVELSGGQRHAGQVSCERVSRPE